MNSKAMKLRIIEVITTGLPFCAFKIVAGAHYDLTWLSVLGLLDLGFNLVNLLLLIITKDKKVDSCFFSFIFHKLMRRRLEKDHGQDLGEAFDVLVSFSIVAYVIGTGDIAKVNPWWNQFWSIAVVFNVLGAGYFRFHSSIDKIKQS